MKKLIPEYGNKTRVLASAPCGRYHTPDDGQTDVEKQLIPQMRSKSHYLEGKSDEWKASLRTYNRRKQ